MSNILPAGGAGLGFTDILAIVAVLVSLMAAWYSLRVSVHAKRKADGLLGDLPPHLSLHPLVSRLSPERPFDDFLLRVDNHNRRPLRITRVAVERPKKVGLVAYRYEPPRDSLIGEVDRPHDAVPMSLVVEGTPPGSAQFQSAALKLVLTGDAPKRKRKDKEAGIAVRVEFEILGPAPEKRSEVVRSDGRPAGA